MAVTPGEPLWSPDIKSDARTLKKSHSVDMGVRAAFDVPVTAGGRTTGVLIFSSRSVREPDERLLRAHQVTEVRRVESSSEDPYAQTGYSRTCPEPSTTNL